MVKASFNLLTRYRLEVRLIKRRKDLDEIPLIPNLGKVFRARKGSKVSRFFTQIFEHSMIKRFFGINLVLLSLVSSILPTNKLVFYGNDSEILESPTIFSTEEGVRLPIKELKVTQNYRFFHPGVDLDGKTGDAIFPIMAGKVEKVEYSRFGYGKSIIISHGSGATSLYAHLSKIDVGGGEEVTKETKIGEMGSSGHASGDHLHIEIRENGKSINPLSVFPKQI
ncbi:hypothetical protein A2159_00220 [Candidatus Woesebacteria bacterium RBG_13_34_9]|uniref:M23ase beta-sheet core domain-containing protein n=1 Tax=Candidatus Woesebacteria bacterium RBG_13_34_9 TaxID=1802477 RepID=A0A1F7X5B4_9BACT|nr:MAG: hypothetical protein A2159_00220 [Candidatus Woesebacteria bacterium RBG_13_34_9]